MENGKLKIRNILWAFCILHFAFLISTKAQMPTPGAAKPINIPAVKEKNLANGLTVAVVERKNVPLVTIQLLIESGANAEDESKAGLAKMTASLLTKGTKTRSAEQIAEQIEFLGGSINSGVNWNYSFVSITVTSDKVEKAMAILADVVLNPSFKQEEIDLLKNQTLDELAYNLTQPGFLTSYVAAKYSFGEHPVGGTIKSIESIKRNDILKFKTANYQPDASTLIFTGDISAFQANSLAQKSFSVWKKPKRTSKMKLGNRILNPPNANIVNRILVIDLPNSGQASVSFSKKLNGISRNDADYYHASVFNSIFGGGYSSRLNQEIRIKRGLSYGAGSGLAWRGAETNFATRTQTKNESAAEVAELVVKEIEKISKDLVSETELNPRKQVLIGDLGRDLETNQDLAFALSELYYFGLKPSELNAYTNKIQSVTDIQVRDFAKKHLNRGDVIIVGDYAKFKDDLAKRFPNVRVEVIKADDLDLSKPNLRK